MGMKKTNYDSTEKIAILLAALFGAAALYWIGYVAYKYQFDIETIGKWGDISAPFLAIAGTIMLLITFRRQRIDSEDNHNELLRQRFESDFLQLLRLLQENLQNNLSDNDRSEPFAKFYKDQTQKHYQSENESKQPTLVEAGFQASYLPFSKKYAHKIEHIVLCIEYSFDFIIKSCDGLHIDEREKKNIKEEKIRLLNTQISTDVLFMVFYHHYRNKEGDKLIKYKQQNFFMRLEIGKNFLSDNHNLLF